MAQSFGTLVSPLSARHYAQFYEQLGRGLKAGLPAGAALAHMTRAKWPPALKTVLADLTREVNQGVGVSDGLALHPQIVDPFDRHWLGAAEAAGRLPQALESLAARYRKKHTENLRLLSSLVYPSGLLTAAALLGPLHLAFAGELDRYLKTALSPLGMLFTAGLFIYWVAHAPAGLPVRRWATRCGFQLPFFAPILKNLSIAQLGLLLAECLGAGLPPSRTFALAAAATAQPALAEACGAVEQDVLQGDSLGTAMHRHPEVFPAEMLSIIDTGEASGRLDEALAQASVVWQEDADRSLGGLIRFVAGSLTAVALGTVGLLILNLGMGIIQRINTLLQM